MPFARAGSELEVDLSRANIEKRKSDVEQARVFLGGRGPGTKMFWDRVPPETDPFSPHNLLIFVAGLLTGTLAPGANRTTLLTRSPQTKLLTYSTLGGFWGTELKHAGYDSLIISGRSPTPVYVWINDDRVEIRDANHLWGHSVKETQRTIREELGQAGAQIVCIGPAGENRVFSASIQHGVGCGASRAGVGAVMGDKNLKAVAVYGTRDIDIAQPAEFSTACERILAKSHKAIQYWDDWADQAGEWMLGGAYGYLDRRMPIDNAGEWLAEFTRNFKTRKSTCYNCAIGCKSVISLPDGRYSFIKCSSWFNFLLSCKIRDLMFSVRCYELCELYGLDVISTASLIAFAIDLYEKGILTDADTDGLRLQWGNQDLAFTLIKAIATREGIGDVLANGVFEAARLIGRGAEEHALHIKKLEPVPYPMDVPFDALRAAVVDKPDVTRAEGFVAAEGLGFPREWKEEYIKSGFFSYPQELQEIFLDDYVGTSQDYEKVIPFISHEIDKNALGDCTGICIFWTGFWRHNPILIDDHVRLINHASGMDVDETKVIDIARRVATLMRSYNVCTGIRRKDDTIPKRYFQASPGSSRVPLDRGKFEQMKSAYYKLRGWNSEGVPGRQELDRLGLQSVRRDLEERGILR